MHTENLELLAVLLVKNAHDPVGMMFDLGAVNTRPDGVRLDSDDWFRWKPQRSCGTKGCAIGLVAVSPEFPDLLPSSGLTVKYRGEELVYFDAASKLFGISRRTSHWLFTPDRYPLTPHKGKKAELEVARRIREVIALGDHLGEFPAMQKMEEYE